MHVIVYLSVPHREQRWVALEQDGIRWPWFEDAARLLLRNRGVPENRSGFSARIS